MKRCCLLVLFVFISFRGFSWGFFAHRLINYQAVFLLPPEMIVFYKPHIGFISDHAVDPDKRRYAVLSEGPRHYIDLDMYEGKQLPHAWSKAVEVYCEDTLAAHGVVPWWIQVMMKRLTRAFREKNLNAILKLSAETGHYIGDAHVPLHTSANHNGQLTNQHGIHGFWESRIPELFAETDWDLFAGKAVYLRNPLQFTWDRVAESYKASDSVLKFEKKLNDEFNPSLKYAFEERNGMVIKQYSSGYSSRYNSMLDGMIERRLRQSILAVASFWYTAWVNAGQPDLINLTGQQFSPEEEKDLNELEISWKQGKIKGRSCD